MRKIAEALRLKAAGLSTRKIASSLSIGQSTVSEYLKRADRAGLSWPLPADLSDADLDARLFQPQGAETRRGLTAPDWATVHSELKRSKSVTLSLLWEEYRADHPNDGYGYSPTRPLSGGKSYGVCLLCQWQSHAAQHSAN
jgi:hypothetical protein